MADKGCKKYALSRKKVGTTAGLPFGVLRIKSRRYSGAPRQSRGDWQIQGLRLYSPPGIWIRDGTDSASARMPHVPVRLAKSRTCGFT